MSDVRYGSAHYLRPGILLEGSCSVNGQSTWGYRITCEGCGTVDACTVGSSVSHEDGPPRFAREHRECVAHTFGPQTARHAVLDWSLPYDARCAAARVLDGR